MIGDEPLPESMIDEIIAKVGLGAICKACGMQLGGHTIEHVCRTFWHDGELEEKTDG